MLPKYRNEGLTIVPYRTPEVLMAKQQTPTPLQDAIRAQQAVINVLADQHAEALHNVAVIGKSLEMAHGELSALLAQQAAE